MDGKDTFTLRYEDGRGNEVKREVNMTLDLRDYLGTPGFSMLLVAANTHLSVNDLWLVLYRQAAKNPGVARSLSWIQRRRWLFQQPGKVNPIGPSRDRDGSTHRAFKLMAQHATASLRDLTVLLREHGIKRSREWVRRHRVEAMSAD